MSKEFSNKIEDIAKEKGISYIDAVVHYCESTGFEIELAAKTLNRDIKSKIEKEGLELNLLKQKD